MAVNDFAAFFLPMQYKSHNLELMNACASLSVLKRSYSINRTQVSLICGSNSKCAFYHHKLIANQFLN